MLSRELFGLELVQELVHLVRIDPWPEAIDKGADLEPRGFYGFPGHAKTDSQGLIDRGLETLPALSNGPLEPLGDIWIESERRTHESIMVLSPGDVQMSSPSRCSGD
jgi:hypothetical protein